MKGKLKKAKSKTKRNEKLRENKKIQRNSLFADILISVCGAIYPAKQMCQQQ
jgi:hypothetical protein